MSVTLQSYSSNTENVTPLPQASSGFFDNRVVCCLKEAGEAFCNLISSLWDKITSVISYFTGTKTLEDRETGQADKTAVVSQLKEEASQLTSYVDRADFVKKLTGVKLDSASLKQVMTAVCDDHGNTPMHYAINNADSLAFLKDVLGEDQFIELLKVKDNDGRTPMHDAAWNAEVSEIFEGRAG